MKKIYFSLILAAWLLFFSKLTPGVANIPLHIMLAVFPVLALGFMAQFPVSAASFLATSSIEKVLAFFVVSFANALALFVAPAIAAYLFNLTIAQMMFFYLAVLLGAHYYFRNAPGTFEKQKEGGKKAPAYPLLDILFLGSLVAAFFLSVHYGCWLSGDYTWHGTYLRKLRELSPIMFRNYLVADLPYPQYGHNIWHLFLVLLSYITKLDVAYLYTNCNYYVPAAIIGAVYFLAKEMFRDAFWAKVSVLFYVLFFVFLGLNRSSGDLPFFEGRTPWSENAYSAAIAALVFFVLVVYYLVRGVRTKKFHVTEILFFTLIMCFTHFYYMFQLAFLLGVLFCAALIFRSDETGVFKAQLRAYWWAFVPGLLYMVYYKQILDSPTVNYIFTSPDAGVALNVYKKLSDTLVIVSPVKGFLRNAFFGPSMLCGFALLFFLKDKKFWKLYLVMPMLFLALIYFNPWLMLAAKKVNPALDRIYRVIEVLPVAFMPAGLLYVLNEEKKLIRKKHIAAGLVVLFAALFPVIKKYNAAIRYNAALWEQTIGQHLQYKNVMERFVPPGSNIFIDPQIAWTWTTIFPHYLYIHPFPGGLPPNYDPNPRLKLWRGFFDAPIREAELQEILAARIDYFVMTRATYQKKEKELAAFTQYFNEPVFIDALGLVAIAPKPR